MFRAAALAALAVLIGQGCTAAGRDRIERGVEQSEKSFDTLAKVDRSIFCSMTVGALVRVYSQDEIETILKICEPRDGP